MRLYVDGASRGNPGDAGGGIVLKSERGVIEERAVYFGRHTNNEAEYLALIAGLELARERGIKKLEVYMDSELVVKQMRGEYRVKNKRLLPLWKKAKEIASTFEIVDFHHIPRVLNARADQLANAAIDPNKN